MKFLIPLLSPFKKGGKWVNGLNGLNGLHKYVCVVKRRIEVMSIKIIRLFPLFIFQFCVVSSVLAEKDMKPGYSQMKICNPIRIEGNSFFEKQELLSRLLLKSSLTYSDDLLEKSIDRVLTLYEENGFPYCQVSPADFKITDEGKLSFSLKVDEGPRVKINKIEFEGLKNTKERVIRRESGLGNDSFGFFSQNKIDKSLESLKRLSFIKDIEEVNLLAENDPIRGICPENAVLKIKLAEKRNSSFSGILGYVPSIARGGMRSTPFSGSKNGYLTGKIDLAFDNILGTGRRLDLNWYRKDSYSSSFSIFYREPWILGLPPTLDLGINQTDYDSTYLQLSTTLGLLFNPLEKLSWEAEAGWEKVVPGAAGRAYLPQSRKYKAGVKLTLNLLDYPNNPRKGIFHQTQVTYGRKRNYPTSDFVPDKKIVYDTKFSLDFDHFLPTFRKQTFMTGMHLRGMTTNEESDDPSGSVPFPEQFKLGGINSLRGYREEEFSGTKVAWTNLEYRFLWSSDSRFFVFADYGYFFREARSTEDSLLRRISGEKLGYGFGIRIDSRAGLLGIDYGIGEKDKLSEGKIHFGIVNRF
jgi:outer membrane protein insertion porin family